MKKPTIIPLKSTSPIRLRVVVACMRCCLMGLFAHAAHANPSIEEDLALSLLQHLGITETSNSSITNEWTIPATATIESTSLSIVPNDGKDNLFSIFDMESNVVARISVSSAMSESDLKMSWALDRTARSIAPTAYFDSFITTNVVNGISFIYERQGRAPHFGPISEARFYCFVGKTCFEVSNVSTNVEGIALALLRAGGVNIPDETQPEPSATP